MDSPQNRPEPLNSAEAVWAQFRVAIDRRLFNLTDDRFRCVFAGGADS